MKLKESKIDFRTGTFPAIFGFLFTSVIIGPASATDITGDTVTGDLTVEGDSVGVTNGLAKGEGFELRFDDNSDNQNIPRRADFWHKSRGEWVWSYGGTPADVMVLGDNNILNLYSEDPDLSNPAIELDPGDPAEPRHPAIFIDDSEAVTAANAPNLLSGSFVARSSANQGSEDSLLMEGPFGYSDEIPAQGLTARTARMMWYPEKSVFRVGRATNSEFEWTESNVGHNSTAFGHNVGASGIASFSAGEEVLASGDHAVAMGYQSEATGHNSVAMGSSATASGTNSSALAGGWAEGSGSFAASGGQAYGVNSTAFSNGYAGGDRAAAHGWGVALGDLASAFGNGWAEAQYSAAFGGSSANGDYSAAFGGSNAYGDFSAAFGDWGVRATSFASVALGRHNEDFHDDTDATTIEAAETSWQGDRQHSVFEVGIGQSGSAPSNGLTVFQDGLVELGKSTADIDNEDDVPLTIEADGSVILAKPQGDISMGIYQ
jgi:hypothetical protein